MDQLVNVLLVIDKVKYYIAPQRALDFGPGLVYISG